MSGAGLKPVPASVDGAMTLTGKALRRLPELLDYFTTVPMPIEMKKSQALRLQDIGKREAVELVEVDGPDVSVLPGKPATEEAIAEEKLRSSIIDLINYFFSEGHSRQVGRVSTISPDTRSSAIALFSALPPGLVPPKLSPDGDGGLMMLWESGTASALAVLDGWMIHVVKAPATAQAEYFDNVPYDRERIPPALLQAIPTK